MANRRQTWPYNGEASSPAALTLSPDGTLNSGRSLAGPLRKGTAGSVGPSGFGPGNGASDFGTDRVSPRHFDPMGTSDTRAPPFPESRRVQR